MLQAMDLQRLADWGVTKVSNKRVRVLLGYLLPAGMQIRQVGSTVEPGAHPSRRLFGCQGTCRAQSDKPHHCLLLTQTQPAPRIHSSNSCRPKPSTAKHSTEQSHSTARPGPFWVCGRMRYEQQGNKSAASFFHCHPFRDTNPDCQSSAARKLHTKQASWQRRC